MNSQESESFLSILNYLVFNELNRNAILVASMIYHTFKSSVMSKVSPTHPDRTMHSKLDHVESAKRLKLSTKKVYAQHHGSSVNPEVNSN